MRAVAKETGVSVATVSRVINNSDAVSSETRQRVLDAMKTMGFVPNPVARALSKRRTKTIAAVIPTIESSIFAKFLHAVEQELAIDGYALVIATSDNRKDREASRAKSLLEMGAEGLILSGAAHSDEMHDLIATRQIPTVCTSIYRTDTPYATVGYDNFALGRLAVRYLLSLGHRDIGVLHGPRAENDRTDMRLMGAEAALGESDAIGGDNTVLVETSLSVDGGVRAVRSFSSAGWRPTALLCLSDVIALGAIFELGRTGKSVPDDVSVMGFDDLDWAERCNPPLTSIRLPTVEMGRRAARALIEVLDRGTPLESRRLDADIVERSSTAPPGAGGHAAG